MGKAKDVKLAILRGPDAKDIVWLFRFSGGAVANLHACDARRSEPETVDTPREKTDRTFKLCRACTMATDAAESECPFCRGRRFSWPRPRPEGVMAVKASKRCAARSTTEMHDRRVALVPKERRVRAGVAKLPAEQQAVLQLWAMSKQPDPEIWAVLGQVSDLAMHMDRLQTAHAKYIDDGGAYSLATWLIGICKQDKPLIGMAKREAEDAVVEALEAYREVRDPPPKHELNGIERACVRTLPRKELPKPKIRRRSVLERVRAMVEAKLKGVTDAHS
jgi:hypothetical protein